ncbi:hypothetical protein BX616_003797 [Lobosporangium transversale]|uniref:FAD-binding domain-containing protein n=1 Tax=Lobosporangium transversale TaxID=64571 RepID=A0A1Y2H344_9FUNG|nr:hypothetical protein BCR41DRAFT_391394 [Lobosporangium transversale]KAF9916419.1 hypothetical protein BX616_003797 [Lobosporangium transversale]ORZ28980.1 hypothetical protein BCR41DRAFT_391394 [Lobosporangium transversale]|eukprot:XP_021886653.1 hypothetical protein BCR41DRAFT_391394 [Lobosporangium transversale]
MSSSNVKVIIVGAGVCGLLTAIQLERAGMDYIVVEKACKFSPLGSALSLTPACNYILDQLGLLEEIQKHSLPCAKIDYLRDDLSKVGSMDAGDQITHYGYCGILLTRPTLYHILLSHVPKEKVHWGKRLVGFKQDDHGVEIECEDLLSNNDNNNNNTVVYKGDILIGADGAYSSVRRNMYKNMQEEGIVLPKKDLAPLRFDSDCVVGVTDEVSLEDYPALKQKNGDFYVIIGKEKAIQRTALDGKSVLKPTEADDLCNLVRHYKNPLGGTVGDLIDRTPKERLSKILLEDKYFSTWYHKRTVLMGDACHKHLPFGGQGANQAILDSVHLVNQLYGIPSNSLQDIEKSFKAYYQYRSSNAKEVFKNTSLVGTILSSRGWISDMVRFLALAHLPDFINNAGMDGMNTDRPYLCFLPPPAGRGTVKPNPQAVPVHYKRESTVAALV